MSVGTSHFVVVTLAKRFFAIDADAVQGIMDVPDAAYGLAPTFKGDIYHGIDLAGCFAIEHTQQGRFGQIVLLMRDHRRGSLKVERVHGRMDLKPSQVLPLPPHFQGAEREWYPGMILLERSVAVILNSRWLLESVAGIRPTDDRTMHQPMGGGA